MKRKIVTTRTLEFDNMWCHTFVVPDCRDYADRLINDNEPFFKVKALCIHCGMTFEGRLTASLCRDPDTGCEGHAGIHLNVVMNRPCPHATQEEILAATAMHEERGEVEH